MKKINDGLVLGDKFSIQHIRDGELLAEFNSPNKFIDEGLIYAINVAFGASLGGAPTPLANIYMMLTQANRTWQSSDAGATIHTVGDEFELFTEATRPEWTPQTLAVSGVIQLDNSSVEGTFTIGDLTSVGGTANIYGAAMITANAKDGSGDATALLIAGSNFPAVRPVLENDVLKVGYTLKGQSVV